VHFLDAVGFGARAERRLRARGAAAEQNAVASLHLCVSRASAIIASAMDAPGRRYRAGESLEDFCRACKTDRMHTVIASDDDGRPIRVACGYCRSEHNYRGGPRVGLVPGSSRAPDAIGDPKRVGPHADMDSRRATLSGSPRPRSDRSDREPFPIVSERERTGPPMPLDGGDDLEL